jgi:Tfp pilus assembly protein PilV
MSSESLVLIGPLALLLVLIVLGLLIGLLGRGSGDTRAVRQRSTAMKEREAAIAAQLAVEEHDIEEMIEAQDALRRRTGRQPIGEELLDEALDPRYDE